MCDPSLLLQAPLVLIVENDRDCRDLLTMVFEMYGIRAIATTTVSQALEILEQVTPNLIVSEIGLPDKDGYSFMHQLKTLEAERDVHIPAIALTTYVSDEDRIQALAAGFNQHLSKPCDIDVLITAAISLTRGSFYTIQPCVDCSHLLPLSA